MDLKHIYPLPHHSPILEPELDVLLLQPGELVPVGLRVEVLREARDQGLRRVRVGQEPLLQPRDLRHCGAYQGLCLLTNSRVRTSVSKGNQMHFRNV